MKRLFLNVDYHDLVLCASRDGEGFYDEKRIEGLMKDCAENGIDTVFWRTSIGGKVGYPSKVMTVYDGEFRPYVSRALVKILERFDPLEVATSSAHQYGLKIFAWVTPFDRYLLEKQDQFFLEHPQQVAVTSS